jgi:hypothetical protein
MKNTRPRNPAVSQLLHPRPRQMMLLAPMDQHRPPEPNHPIAECGQTVGVSGYRVVVEVALDDQPEPLAGLRYRFMHSSAELLLDFQQLGPHSFADRFALHGIAPVPALPADMREPQKIGRLRLPFSSLFPVLLGEPPELTKTILHKNGFYKIFRRSEN